jgi:hypothetical protein
MLTNQEGLSKNTQSPNAQTKRQYTLRTPLLLMTALGVLRSVWVVLGRPLPSVGVIEYYT